MSKLSIGERILLTRWFENRKFNFACAVICKSVLSKIEITSEEIAKYDIKSPDNNTITWDKSVEDANINLLEHELHFILSFYFTEKSEKQQVSQKDIVLAEHLFGTIDNIDV